MELENILKQDNLLENFADRYLAEAIRIINTKDINPDDGELLYDSLCLTVQLYMNKLKSGEISSTRVLH